MAEAVCGPSNPLQNFQKHTSTDRTLQQDRLTARAGPSQGFRSHPGSTAGLLDPEFEAFQVGQATGFVNPQPLQPSRQNFLHFQAPALQGPSNNGGWASDFQRLHISQPQSSQSQLRPQPAAAGWHLDFQRQQQPPSLQQPQHIPQAQYAQQTSPTYNFSSGLDMQQPHFRASSFTPQHFEPLQQESRYDAAAFEQEFEAHASTLLRQEQQHVDNQVTQTPIELGLDVLVDGPDVLQSFDDNVINSDLGAVNAGRTQSREAEATAANALEKPSEELDVLMKDVRELQILQEISRKEAVQHNAVDSEYNTQDEDLARTAGELLQRVADDTSAKFRESDFLSLMARLRDREVRVEGNEFVSQNPTAAEAASERVDKQLQPLVESNTESFLQMTPRQQRPSSVPSHRRAFGDGWQPTSNIMMTGALNDADVRVDNSEVPPSNRAPAGNFQEWLAENGLLGTHMVNDF